MIFPPLPKSSKYKRSVPKCFVADSSSSRFWPVAHKTLAMFKLILHFILVVVVLVSAKTTNPPKPVLRPEDSLVFGIQDALIRSNGTARLAAVSIIKSQLAFVASKQAV